MLAIELWLSTSTEQIYISPPVFAWNPHLAGKEPYLDEDQSSLANVGSNHMPSSLTKGPYF